MKSKLEWILDSSCSVHICLAKKCFIEFKKNDYRHFFLGDNFECKLEGICKVMLSLNEDTKLILKNVRYVPEIKKKSIIVGMLDDTGCLIRIETGCMRINNGLLVKLNTMKRNGLYILKGKIGSTGMVDDKIFYGTDVSGI